MFYIWISSPQKQSIIRNKVSIPKHMFMVSMLSGMKTSCQITYAVFSTVNILLLAHKSLFFTLWKCNKLYYLFLLEHITFLSRKKPWRTCIQAGSRTLKGGNSLHTQQTQSLKQVLNNVVSLQKKWINTNRSIF